MTNPYIEYTNIQLNEVQESLINCIKEAEEPRVDRLKRKLHKVDAVILHREDYSPLTFSPKNQEA